MDDILYILLGIMCVVAGITWLARQIGRWRENHRDRLFIENVKAAIRSPEYPYEYTHRCDGDHVVYEFNIRLLSDFRAIGGPDWDMGDVRVKELNGEPIPPDQQFPWLNDWDNHVVDMAEAELIAAGGPCVTDFDHSYDDWGD